MNKHALSQLFVLLIMAAFIGSCEKNDDSPINFKISMSENSGDPGSQILYTTSQNEFALNMSPASSDLKNASSDYNGIWMGETELTYSLYTEIYDWAQQNGYQIKSDGQPGSNVNYPNNHPVTVVCWRDAVVWCNALTEYYNLFNGDNPDYDFAYLYDNQPIKNSNTFKFELEMIDFDESATGFRIPTNDEWFAAASYGTHSEDCASGASSDYHNEQANDMVAWSRSNSEMHSHPVGQKLPNALGLYDMSGNVREIVYDKLECYNTKYNDRGGAWNSNADKLAAGSHTPDAAHSSSHALGFRITRTLGDDNYTNPDVIPEEEPNDIEGGEGFGSFTLNGASYPLSKGFIFNYNNIGAGLIVLNLMSDGISLDSENSGGYTGTGNLLDISIYTNDAQLTDGTNYTSSVHSPIISAFTNCGTDVFPFTYDENFIGGSNVTVQVDISGDEYTLTFSCDGIVSPSGTETGLSGEYTGTLVNLIAGQDF